MKVYHIGTISCETDQSGRVTCGSISGYIKDLIDYSQQNSLGQKFNYELAGMTTLGSSKLLVQINF